MALHHLGRAWAWFLGCCSPLCLLPPSLYGFLPRPLLFRLLGSSQFCLLLCLDHPVPHPSWAVRTAGSAILGLCAMIASRASTGLSAWS